jgi:hypothetical protein
LNLPASKKGQTSIAEAFTFASTQRAKYVSNAIFCVD